MIALLIALALLIICFGVALILAGISPDLKGGQVSKTIYEELPEVLFQEEKLLRFIREEFTVIALDMKAAGYFDNLSTVGDYALSDAVRALIDKRALVAGNCDLNKLKDTILRLPLYGGGSLSTQEQVLEKAIMCLEVFGVILLAFGGGILQKVREEVREALSDEA